jgi:hypothetical protein
MHQQINFYEGEFRSEAQFFGATTLMVTCGTLVLAMLLVYVFAAHKVAGLENELQLVIQREITTLERLEEIRPVINATGGGRSWSDRLDEAARTLEDKQLVLGLVQGSTLGDTLGFSRYLGSLARQDTEGLWLTQIQLSALGDKNQLQGKALRAELVATYLQNLTEEPAFSAQRFNQFQIDGPEQTRAGIVTFSMNSEAQLDAGMADSR